MPAYPYFPADHWEFSDPATSGFDPARLTAAAALAASSETPWPRDLQAHLESGFFEPPPDNEVLGPIAPRGAPNGLMLRGGRVVARWGDTRQIDQTFSVAKSYLSLLAGLAIQDGLIRDLDEPVSRSVRDGGFDGPHNAAVTWRHLLQQTSEWEGTLFGKSDVIDRGRNLGVEGKGRKGVARPLHAPGTYWEYNDVRVNRLSLSLMRVFGRPLPEIFAERIMRPLGASGDWRWEGYRTSFVEIGGRTMQAVPGGSHWGGGVFIHAEDQARVGLLMLCRGEWDGRPVIARDWIAQSLTPCPLNPNYGFCWWLNTNRAQAASAPESSFFAKGAGGNITWIDPEHDIVGVFRWLDPAALGPVIGAVLGALR